MPTGVVVLRGPSGVVQARGRGIKGMPTFVSVPAGACRTGGATWGGLQARAPSAESTRASCRPRAATRLPCRAAAGSPQEGSAAGRGAADQILFEHSVLHTVGAPLEESWRLWADLARAPEWMRWIDRVEVIEAGGEGGPPQVSRWVCSTGGFEVSWVARMDRVEDLADSSEPTMEWATIEGLTSRGRVVMSSAGEGATEVQLSVSHSLPAGLGDAIGAEGLRGLVQATLKSDLERFDAYARGGGGEGGAKKKKKRRG